MFHQDIGWVEYYDIYAIDVAGINRRRLTDDLGRGFGTDVGASGFFICFSDCGDKRTLGQTEATCPRLNEVFDI